MRVSPSGKSRGLCLRGIARYFFSPAFLLVWFLLAAISAQGATYYVSPTGNDANNGTSWALAKQTIQAAINTATSGDTVLVADGTYLLTNQIEISPGITVRSLNGAQSTIIDGGGVTRCVYLENAVLDGFTVINGNGDGNGGGIWAWASTVQNCMITGNRVGGLGGGIYNWESTLQNCTISGNSARYGGGVAAVSDGFLSLVQNCTITRNTGVIGGGIYIYTWGGALENTNSVIWNCAINGNSASYYGGGVCLWGGTVRNCTINGNNASSWGGGIDVAMGTVQNCTISENTVGYQGGGMFIANGKAQNCIAYYNQNGDVYNYNSCLISYSCIGTGDTGGVGNITNEPQFVSLGTGYGTNLVPGNYRLRPTSPCINTGTNQSWMVNAVDLDSLPRIMGGIVDMGAYEGLGANNAIMRNPATLFNQCSYGSNAVGQTFEVWNAGTGALAYALSANVSWLSLSPANGMSEGEADLVSVSYANAGLAPGSYIGIVTITSAQAINSPQVVTVNLLVDKASQTIDFPAIPDQTVISHVVLAATASSGLPVSFTVESGLGIITDGSTLSFTAAGTVLVVASQAGNAIYNPAPNVTNAVIVIDPAFTADLEVSDFKFVPVNLWAGDHPAMISFDLVNDGPEGLVVPDAQLAISFYLSVNQTFGDGDDIAIGTKIEALTLPAGDQTTIRYPGRAHNEDVTIPEGLTGDYYVFVNVRLASSTGVSDPDGAYAMRDGPINVRIHPNDGGGESRRRAVVSDYDGDEVSDMMSFDEPSGEWAVRLSASGELVRFIFGGAGFEPVPADYDGDGKVDPAIHDRQGSAWSIMLSELDYQTLNFNFGGAGETKGVVGDYDEDGLADPGLYEEVSGRWYVLLSYAEDGNGGMASAVFGGSGYLPVAGDYDGDGKVDPAVYGEATGDWQVLLSGQGYGVVSAVFGGAGYAPVVGDYDGDGKADPMLYNQATGEWSALMSGNGYALKSYQYGAPGGQPLSGDFDGDGQADPAVLDSSGAGYFWLSSSSYLRAGPYTLASP